MENGRWRSKVGRGIGRYAPWHRGVALLLISSTLRNTGMFGGKLMLREIAQDTDPAWWDLTEASRDLVAGRRAKKEDEEGGGGEEEGEEEEEDDDEGDAGDAGDAEDDDDEDFDDE